MKPTKIIPSLLAAAASSLVAFADGPTPGPQPTIHLTPSQIEINTFYCGTLLHVDGVLPSGYRAAVLLTGKGSDIELQRKGRVWGLLWMNVGDVSFEQVPPVYLIVSDGRLCELAPLATRAPLGLGLDALEDKVLGPGVDESRRSLFRELVKLREKEGLFSVAEGSVRVSPIPTGGLALSAELQVPARIHEGSYDLQLWGFRNGEATLLGATRLEVAQVGATRFLSGLARAHGLLFGLLAVVIALAAGILTGVVFGLGGKKGH